MQLISTISYEFGESSAGDTTSSVAWDQFPKPSCLAPKNIGATEDNMKKIGKTYCELMHWKFKDIKSDNDSIPSDGSIFGVSRTKWTINCKK